MVAPARRSPRLPKWKHVTIGLTPELHARLTALADRDERLVEQQAAYYLRLAIERAERTIDADEARLRGDDEGGTVADGR